jgi:neutral ceramidase
VAGKIIRRFLRVILLLLVIAALLVGFIDRTPMFERRFANDMMTRLDRTRLNDNGSSSLRSGWDKVNITPDHSMPMAGYMPRDHFDLVHDSLFARIIVIENGSFTSAMIDIDLLIFPPKLRDLLYDRVDSSTFLYLSATHTHSSVGGWDPSLGGSLIAGQYSEEYVINIADKIAAGIKAVNTKSSTIQYWETDASSLVENRVNVDSGKIDGKIRGVKLQRSDSTSAVLFTYSAHSTSIAKERLELSADYPAKVIELLEHNTGFAMFMSGMVGSHRYKYSPYNDYDFIEDVAPKIVSAIDTAHYDPAMTSPQIKSRHIPIEFGPSNLRIAKNWSVNDWLFRSAFGKLKGELTCLEIGDVMFIGTPCDFSGEIYTADSLEQYATAHGKHLIITSFNGDYDGYITYDKHYYVSTKEEINALNWVGPFYGKYFSEMIKKVVAK